jgi:TM2 domain-containing membrane protein YozV
MNCRNCGFGNASVARFCVRCGTPLAAASPMQPHQHGGPMADGAAFAPPMLQRGFRPPAPPAYPRPATGEPVLAAVLSLLIVGLGQFYNHDVKKGLVMLGIAVVGGVLTLGLVWLGAAAWSAVDAWQVAAGRGQRWS